MVVTYYFGILIKLSLAELEEQNVTVWSGIWHFHLTFATKNTLSQFWTVTTLAILSGGKFVGKCGLELSRQFHGGSNSIWQRIKECLERRVGQCIGEWVGCTGGWVNVLQSAIIYNCSSQQREGQPMPHSVIWLLKILNDFWLSTDFIHTELIVINLPLSLSFTSLKSDK